MTSAANAAKSPEPACPQCGAAVRSDESTCWLCGAALVASKVLTPEPGVLAPPGRESTPHRAFSFSLSTMLLVMTLVAVCLGLLAVAPGIGILVGILLAPVLVRTTMVVKRRERTGRPVSSLEQAGLIATSLVVAHVMVAVVATASIGTFCGTCLGLAAVTPGFNYRQHDIHAMALLSGALALAVTLLSLRWIWRWMRRRYRRDVGDELLASPAASGESRPPLAARIADLGSRYRREAAWAAGAAVLAGTLAWLTLWDAVYFLGGMPASTGAVNAIAVGVAIVAFFIVLPVIAWHSRRGSL